MSLKEQIQQDLNSSLKERKEIDVITLRMLNAAILNKEKEKRNKLSKEKLAEEELAEEELAEKSQLIDEEIIEVIASEVKKRKEAILEFEKGERQDLAEKEKKEIEVLKKYLPEQLPEEEIRKLVQESIGKVGAQEMKDIGKVMAELMPQVKGKADGSLVNKIVRELLTPTKQDS